MLSSTKRSPIVIKQNLDEITFIRPILIFMLVMYHAFAPWCGAWREPDGFIPNQLYWWWGKLNYSFMLETFVLISGYIFAYQLSRDKISGFKSLILSKFKRLIIPSAIFSVLYIYIFKEFTNNIRTLYEIINGVAHMWFLPMLFWCFIAAYLIYKLNISDGIKLMGLVLFATLSFIPFPLHINSTMYYLFFFYGGIILFKNKEKICTYLAKYKNAIWLFWLAFIVFFLFFTIVLQYLTAEVTSEIIIRIVRYSGTTLIKMTYAAIGTFSIYITALQYTKVNHLATWIINVSSMCFGVYLFQQFILQLLYYKIPLSMNPLVTPWVGFIIAIIASLIITFILMKSKIGRSIL